MIFFIIGVLAALVALAVLLLSEEGKAAAFIPGVVAVILIGVSCVSYVPTGYTGIVTTFGKVEDGTKDADLIAANAEAEKSKVAADAELYVAEKKAEANRALNDSLNSNLLEYYRITNVDSLWNGELPTYVGGDGSIPIINGIN